ncbi:MAG TPA: hypothetical protein VMR06_12500 [Dokdonella sp.]|uniref:hypothetical protein n=1 Tax=Dokdonella sp. TaxID=2291710 RepID=UPI002BBB2B53|nr:hypothetical protein [Dokdonella sp.]HUD42802.1 hypothetical protein [Dokdonella sp.]
MASDLRALRQWPLREASDLDGWHREIQAVVERWGRDLPHMPIVPEIWHYLHDADIRLRDRAYCVAQEARLDTIITDMERGVLPASGRVSVVLPWPVVAALVVIGVMIWLLT